MSLSFCRAGNWRRAWSRVVQSTHPGSGGIAPSRAFPGGVVWSRAVIPASQRSSLYVCLRQFELAVEFLVLWSCLV